MREGFGWLLFSVVALVVLIGTVVGLEAAGLTWYAPWKADKQTEVTRNTNQYVTTQQEAINAALLRYNTANNDALKWAAADDMCRAANRIDDEDVPQAAKAPMMQRGCWVPGGS